MMVMCKWLLSYIENNETNSKQTTNPIVVVLIDYREFFCLFIYIYIYIVCGSFLWLFFARVAAIQWVESKRLDIGEKITRTCRQINEIVISFYTYTFPIGDQIGYLNLLPSIYLKSIAKLNVWTMDFDI